MGFAVASLLASAIGASVAVALRGIIPHTKVLAQAWRLSSGATVAFSCPSDVVNGSLALRSDGTLMCSENTTTFVLHDVARTFVVESEAIAPSVAEQLVSVAESVFPVSLPGAFLNGDVLSLVMGGLALGVALWITDPLVACVNVTTDALVTLVIAHYVENKTLHVPATITESDESGALTQELTPDRREQELIPVPFRDPMETFNGPKRIPWPGAMAHAHATIDAQDDLLVDLYYKTPSLWLTTAAGAVGVVAGGLLNKYSISENAQLWIGLMGTLLIRALECLTLPLMFTSVTTCFSNLVVSNKTRPVMMRLAIYFVLAALLSSCVAIAVAFCFAGYFTVKPDVSPATTNFQFILRCPNGKLFSRVGECTAQSVRDGQILTATNVTGLPDALQQSLAATSGVFPGYQSLAAQIVEFFGDFFTENITEAFVVVQFLGITIFSMIIGATIMKVYDPSSGELNHALVLTRQIHVVLEMILNWLVPYIPLGTLSMMSFSIMTGEFSQQAMRDSFYFTLAMVVALLVNFFAVACVFYAILVRRNPLKFVWFLMPGVIYMLATGNYLATVPVLMRSLEKSQQVSRTLAQFTICMGVSLCLCGTAIFFVVASIFMAYTSGLNEVITPGRSIGLILAATASSIGTPLVPGSALTFTCTIWRTLFTDQVPGSFVYIVAVEWIMYRLRRTYNIIVAAFIARILAEQLDETVEDEEDRVYLDQQLGMTNGPQL
ncbi:hypothetical protein BBP00_00003110 [Phytophthora kernoviae]|uniref:Amino acid transporter n=1 Tax=Phytophthora kernoviae TaxID=325452 RepID=A0A3F2RWB3_9STRA|nr:hypothetical protein BBP00_00003110 [Phytophthora kernoviae]